MAVNQVVYIELVEVEFEIGDEYEVSLAMKSMSWPLTTRSLCLSNLYLPTVQLAKVGA